MSRRGNTRSIAGSFRLALLNAVGRSPYLTLNAYGASSNGGLMPEAQSDAAPRSRGFAIRAVAAAAAVIVAGVLAFVLTSPSGGPRASLIGGPFALQDGNGRTVSDQTLK